MSAPTVGVSWSAGRVAPPPAETMPRTGLVLTSLLTLVACDQWALSIGGNGLLFIGVTGDDHPGRFRVRTREADGASRTLDVPASGQLSLRGLPAGTVELTLLLPPECRVAGPNPQTLTVTADQTASAAFDVRCRP
jgi:hypothetical protein